MGAEIHGERTGLGQLRQPRFEHLNTPSTYFVDSDMEMVHGYFLGSRNSGVEEA